MQVSGRLRQAIGNRALTGSDLDDDVVGGRMNGAHDGIDNTNIGQKMLSESFAGAVCCHYLAASWSASSTAASRLPGSAAPVPAMSNAVP